MKNTKPKHVFHFRRIGLFSIVFLSFFIVKVDAGALNQPGHQASVLAYATEMSRSGLLSGTNAARAANGMAPLNLDSQLNSSAQMKAQDMANKNYWAHVAPDGTQPWYFFDQAGYSYVKAGENLAYGFMSSQGAIDGWMNSASHRANILGQYYDVGFGIVNTPNYQSSGEQTIVVAHYGTRAMAPPPPAPAPATPVAPAAPPQAPIAPPEAATPQPASQPEQAVVEPEADPTPPSADQATPTELTDTTALGQATPVQIGQPARLSVASMIATKTLPIAALTSLALLSVATVGYALTHRSAFQHAMSNGEHFAATHPGIDATIIAAVTALILLTTYGHIG